MKSQVAIKRNTIIQGGSLEVLKTLPDECVDMCVTSPPYWGLRDYGTAEWEGGDAECDHRHQLGGEGETSTKQNTSAGTQTIQYRRKCGKCGAVRKDKQLGLEPTLTEYLEKMTAVFREVRRVLKPTGTLWLNMGDGYASQSNGGPAQSDKTTMTGGKKDFDLPPRNLSGLKPKDLIGQPWRLAFALQSDGWYLRSDIIWSKPNPMPESVTDRPTKAHEYLFLFAKGQDKERIIRFADIKPELVHFGADFGTKSSYSRPCNLCISLAAAIFYVAQSQNDFSLPPFYAQKWKQISSRIGGDDITDLPPIHILAAHSARFLNSDMTAKEFMRQFNRLWRELGNRNPLLVAGGLSLVFNTPTIFVNSDTSITINDSGKVSKIDFVHEYIIDTVHTNCKYFYDADAIREPHARLWDADNGGTFSGPSQPNSPYQAQARDKEGYPLPNPLGRNRRTVWEIATQPFPEAHFATFPEKLVEPCIRAGTSEKGNCSECGKPWGRVVEKVDSGKTQKMTDGWDTDPGGHQTIHRDGRENGENGKPVMLSTTTGWQPSCECNADTERPIVLDPFMGSGTVALVAKKLNRDYLGIELNPEYIEIANKRLYSKMALFMEV